MSNIISAPDLPSDDEEDDDYDPSRDPDAEKDDSDRKGKLNVARLKRTRDSEEDNEDEEVDEEQQPVAALNSKAASKKAKMDALWSQLQQGSSSQRASAEKAASGKQPNAAARPTMDWRALCRPVPKAGQSTDKNRNWMLQLGFKSKQQSSSSASAQEVASQQEPSRTADAGRRTSVEPAPQPASQLPSNGQVSTSNLDTSVAAAALAAAKAAVSATAAASHGKMSVTETRRFAGKNVEMTRTVGTAEAEAERQKRNKAGLDAVLASLQAAKKVNVLDKSRSDWTTFKKSDTKECLQTACPKRILVGRQVEEELEVYKKSGDKYLDKVDFLKRAELREYEKERDARLAGDVRSRGRL